MLEAEGIIIRSEGDDAIVETSRVSACGSCSSNGSCGTTAFNQLLGAKISSFKVLNPIGADVGDRVVIGLEESALLKSSTLLYLIPLALLFAGAVAGRILAPASMEDLYSAAGAGVGLVAGFFALKLATARAGSQAHFHPVILRRAVSHGIVSLGELHKP